MDVRKWLEETAGDASPEQFQQIGADAPKIVDHDNHSAIRRSYRRHRRHESSDALLAPLQHGQHGRRATARGSSRDDIHRRQSRRSRQESDAPSSDRTRTAELSKTYRKRKRHKTKEDRYERKSKKPRKERESRRSPKPGRKERRSGHGGDGDHTMGLVQSFQLKTGRKNSRLTLRPDSNAGFLKHGRASTQFDSRGRGLPDLAFNEMKFLQRPVEQLEPIEAAKPQSAKNHGQATGQDNDISAYFKAQKDAHIKQPDQSRPSQEKAGDQFMEKEANESREAHPKEPPKATTEVPFLGFGSRGPPPPSTHREKHDSSYLTWSESNRQRGTPAKSPPKARAKRLSRKEPVHTDTRPTDEHKGVQPAEVVSPKRATQAAGEWLPSKRVRRPNLVEVYRPALEAPFSECRARPSTRTTVQSLPRQGSARCEPQNAEASFTKQRGRLSNVYRTSDILHIEPQPRSIADRATEFGIPQLDDASAVNNKENRDPSSGIEILLKQARLATEKVRSPTCHRRGGEEIVPATRHLNARHELEDPLYLAQQDRHRVARNSFAPEVRHEPQCHRTPMDLLDPTFVRHGDLAPDFRQSNIESHHWMLGERNPSHEDSITWQTHGWNSYLDDEMLDDELSKLTPSIATARMWATGSGTEVQAFSEPRLSSSNAHRKRFGSHGIEPSKTSSLAQPMAFIPRPASRNACLEASPLVQNDVDSELTGFWKPNRLY